MALVFPLSLAAFADKLRIASNPFVLDEQMQMSGVGTGDVLAAKLAPSRWTTAVTLAPEGHLRARELQALIEALDGPINSFYLYPVTNCYPARDPGGKVLSVINLLRSTAAFDDVSWSKSGSSVVANAALAPDGTMTADKLVEDGSNSRHYVLQAVGGNTANSDYVFSIYLKAGERTQARVSIANTANQSITNTVDVDLITGAATSSVQGRTSVASIGNGWWRVSTSGRTIGSVVTLSPIIELLSGGASPYQGNGISGIYVWGGQHELGVAPSIYSGRGAVAGALAPSIHTRGANNKSVRLTGLPPGYVITTGDMWSADYGMTPVRRALHRASETVVADGAGITPLFDVTPHLPTGLLAGAAVTLKKPAAKMFRMPGPLQVQHTATHSTISFQAVQRP